VFEKLRRFFATTPFCSVFPFGTHLPPVLFDPDFLMAFAELVVSVVISTSPPFFPW